MSRLPVMRKKMSRDGDVRVKANVDETSKMVRDSNSMRISMMTASMDKTTLNFPSRISLENTFGG